MRLPRHATMVRATVAGTVGNVLEWYDFSVYAYLVPSIGAAFFPTASHLAQVLFSFAVFGVGFFMRPIGSVVVGAYGDKAGRRAALMLTVGMMGVSTLAIGLLPTYATAGIWAPILLTLVRLCQGFAAGGEWGGAATFLVEFAPAGRRGYIGSYQQASVGAGLLVGSGFVAFLAYLLGQEALAAWGWRIPFICGIAVAGFAVYFRLRLPDTPNSKRSKSSTSFPNSRCAIFFYSSTITFTFIVVSITSTTISFYMGKRNNSPFAKSLSNHIIVVYQLSHPLSYKHFYSSCNRSSNIHLIVSIANGLEKMVGSTTACRQTQENRMSVRGRPVAYKNR